MCPEEFIRSCFSGELPGPRKNSVENAPSGFCHFLARSLYFSIFSTTSFHAELEKALIVYGTRQEAPSNREAAEALQRGIIERGSNITVPIKADKDVTDEDLRAHHSPTRGPFLEINSQKMGRTGWYRRAGPGLTRLPRPP